MKLLFDILSSIISGTQKLDLKKLPTQGFFYPKDFELKIRKAKIEDIIEYEINFKSDNVLDIIELIKKFVCKNTEFSKSYKFEDIKSIDIIYIFLEIVKFTNNKPIKISYFDNASKSPKVVDFNSKVFNYFNFSVFEQNYLEDLGVFEIDGYRFSMPSIGVENSLTNFLLNRIDDMNTSDYSEKNYDFLFFLGNRNNLTDDEIKNLIIIFNEDIDEQEKLTIGTVIKKFEKLIGYSIKVDNKIIDLKSNLDLENIWR